MPYTLHEQGAGLWRDDVESFPKQFLAEILGKMTTTNRKFLA